VGPKRIHAVDANPRQTALLELKLAGIRALGYADFFQLFGGGRHPDFRDMYFSGMRYELSPFAQAYWDKNLGWFDQKAKPRASFYYRGLAGTVAKFFRRYLDLHPKLRGSVEAVFRSWGNERAIIYRRMNEL